MPMLNNPFSYTDDNKRYHTLSYHLRHKFGKKVIKAVVDAGFSCPNIDGTCGTGGCSYCISGGSEFSSESLIPIRKQIMLETERIRKKWQDAEIIAYFQAHTNTYAPLDVLKRKYEEALSCENVVGISIATRCDCLEASVIDYLASLSKSTYLTVELGLQTIHEKTAQLIGRGHTYSQFLSAYQKLKDKGIRVCIHLINGLPCENFDMMVETAREVGTLKPDALKLHLLHIMKGSRMEAELKSGLITPMEKSDYIKTICAQLEYIPPQTVIERITGDGSRDKLIAPLWSLDKISVLGGIDSFQANNNTYQGKYI